MNSVVYFINKYNSKFFNLKLKKNNAYLDHRFKLNFFVSVFLVGYKVFLRFCLTKSFHSIKNLDFFSKLCVYNKGLSFGIKYFSFDNCVSLFNFFKVKNLFYKTWFSLFNCYYFYQFLVFDSFFTTNIRYRSTKSFSWVICSRLLSLSFPVNLRIIKTINVNKCYSNSNYKYLVSLFSIRCLLKKLIFCFFNLSSLLHFRFNFYMFNFFIKKKFKSCRFYKDIYYFWLKHYDFFFIYNVNKLLFFGFSNFGFFILNKFFLFFSLNIFSLNFIYDSIGSVFYLDKKNYLTQNRLSKILNVLFLENMFFSFLNFFNFNNCLLIYPFSKSWLVLFKNSFKLLLSFNLLDLCFDKSVKKSDFNLSLLLKFCKGSLFRFNYLPAMFLVNLSNSEFYFSWVNFLFLFSKHSFFFDNKFKLFFFNKKYLSLLKVLKRNNFNKFHFSLFYFYSNSSYFVSNNVKSFLFNYVNYFYLNKFLNYLMLNGSYLKSFFVLSNFFYKLKKFNLQKLNSVFFSESISKLRINVKLRGSGKKVIPVLVLRSKRVPASMLLFISSARSRKDGGLLNSLFFEYIDILMLKGVSLKKVNLIFKSAVSNLRFRFGLFRSFSFSYNARLDPSNVRNIRRRFRISSGLNFM